MNIPSAPRRRLGTGPSTARSTTTADIVPRLLPAERADPDGLLEEAEHQDVPAPKGRRNLGPGTAAAPDGAQ